MYHVQDFSFSFGSRKILNQVSFQVQAGQKIVILGESGCGKSTLIRLLAGLIPSDLTLPSLDLGFVFQEANLISWKTTLENTLLGYELQGLLTAETKQKAILLLKKLGLEKSLNLYPEQLSGGMKMRVSIARAILSEPQVLMMDEPFSALDDLTRFELQNLLLNFQKQNPQTTVFFVTHSISEACYLADQIFILRDQKIAQSIPVTYSIDRTDQLRSHPEYTQMVARITQELQSKGQS